MESLSAALSALRATGPSEQPAGVVEALPDWLDEIASDLNNIVRAAEDEGDRVYFGSTNDADTLREIAQKLDALRTDSATLGKGDDA